MQDEMQGLFACLFIYTLIQSMTHSTLLSAFTWIINGWSTMQCFTIKFDFQQQTRQIAKSLRRFLKIHLTESVLATLQMHCKLAGQYMTVWWHYCNIEINYFLCLQTERPFSMLPKVYGNFAKCSSWKTLHWSNNIIIFFLLHFRLCIEW